MNIGVLGGTFDPPHYAHLRIAERSIDQFNLDKVIFIPSGNPWQKKDATSYRHRYEMTKILIGDSHDLEISDIENSEKNPSYTYETLNKYIIVNDWKNGKINSNSSHRGFFPRMWSSDNAENYMKYYGFLDINRILIKYYHNMVLLILIKF